MNADVETTEKSHYRVKTEHFEGPLDLLLTLIEDQKLDITQVSLAEVTDRYLDYVKSREHISLANLTDFLTVAAKLILIKSKALLPLLKFDDDEEEDMQELERQLAALSAIKDLIPDFEKSYGNMQPLYGRKSMWGVTAQFMPQEGLTPDMVQDAFMKSLNAIPQLDAIEEKIISDVMSLEQKISHVQEMVRKRAETVFSEVIEGSKDKAEVVVSFLALLELVKQRIIVAKQEGIFRDIQLKNQESQQESQ